jgi:hypothetical protein
LILKISKTQICLALLFPLFTAIALGIDSIAFLESYFDGRQLTNLLAFGYALLLFYYSGNTLRKLMVVMVVLSYIGELIFCKLLGMYSYRTPVIPLYVPLGHAIVYASGYILAHSAFAIKFNSRLKALFTIGFTALFLSAGLILNDVFTLVFGAICITSLRSV